MKNKGPVFIVPWRCTYACDNSCVHCVSAGKTAVKDEIGTTEAKKLVDQVSDFGATFFGITGGQPFLRKDLFEILDYATEKGLCTSIITDGRMLDEAVFEKIVKNKTRISVSIDGSEETNDAIRGKGAYAAAVSAIERFSKENLLNVLVYTFANAGEITNVNETDMRHVLDLARKYGARWVVFHGMIPYSSDKQTLKADPTPAQYEWLCNKLYDLTQEYQGKPAINVYIPFYARVAKQRGMPDFDRWYNGFFLGRCFFGKFFSVAENGDAIPCSYNDAYRLGNIKEKSLGQIWSDMQTSEFFKKAQDKTQIKGKCGVCEFKDICGGCRSAALYYTGDIYGSDPRCGYIPKSMRQK
ncbi:MAG: radical SAM protein [Candidatus Bathyarchaeota archaeon]|nr:radical SAM protein [Candidatus Bathyarchaeota archaeon]